MLGLGVGLAARGVRGGDLRERLGAALLGLWDAERVDLVTLGEGGVASWRDVVAGYAAGQGVSAARPAWSASGFGGRPGVVFDGVDDHLTLEAVPFPSGNAASEIWVVASDAGGAADPVNRTVFNYGGGTSGTGRGPGRTVSGGVVRARGAVGGVVATDTSVALTGRHVLHQVVGATSLSFGVDGAPPASATYSIATGTDRVRIGGNTLNTGNVWNGAINAILVTAPLTPAQASDVLAWCMARTGR